MSDITPAKVAGFFAEADNELHEGLDGWFSLKSRGNVVEAEFQSAKDRKVTNFRAVVVEGETAPVVVASEVLAAARVLYRAHVNAGSQSTEEAVRTLYEVRAALDALTPEQVAVLAGDDPEAAQAQTGGAQ